MTFGTYRLTTIATHHHTILDLVLVVFHHLEESVDGNLFVHVCRIAGKSMPQPSFLFGSEFTVRGEYGEVIPCSPAAELIFPDFHLLTMPTLYTTVVHAQGGVGNDQPFIDTDDITESLTFRTGTHG